MKHKECEVKPNDGELFVSRILKLEPEDVIFMKPVTVLLCHSVHADQLFLDFYELVIENHSHARGWQELKTELMCFSEGMNSNFRYCMYVYVFEKNMYTFVCIPTVQVLCKPQFSN